jgi:hypothetical protein
MLNATGVPVCVTAEIPIMPDEYKALIMDSVRVISTEEAQRLDSYLKNGGKLIVIGKCCEAIENIAGIKVKESNAHVVVSPQSTYYNHCLFRLPCDGKHYAEENGNLDIPKGYISGGFGLGLWLDRQKKQYRNGKLSDEYIKLLEYIGIDWKENNQIEHLYEIGFQHLEKFISEYGIEALKSNCVCDDGYNLGRWIANCKAKFRKGKLAEKYAVRFEKLGIRLDK